MGGRKGACKGDWGKIRRKVGRKLRVSVEDKESQCFKKIVANASVRLREILKYF